ncbi:hypothetical protein COLO4_17433 [Corchorus olitorius]|uniref:Wall-associated receptor kinase galacturonan-binding domain-containing protein n=1 Tax=Corchorus olitorius TaxID=93759 RepID=A0A1R3JCU2_9ROSI|nr:hypothetical protein COLO4_17433 [Corchorus olitorius]
MAALALFLLPQPCVARTRSINCGSTTCGNLNISYPFRLKTQPQECGDSRLELECDNKTNRATLVMEKGIFFVQDIFYENLTIRVVDSTLGRENCSVPGSSLVLSCQDPFGLYSESVFDMTSSTMYLVNCTSPVNSSLYVNASRCRNSSSYFYFLEYRTLQNSLSDFSPSCTIIGYIPVMLPNITGLSTLDIYEKLLLGVDLSWHYYYENICVSPEVSPFHRLLEVWRDACLDFINSFVYYLFKRSRPVTFGYGMYSVVEKGKFVICLAATGPQGHADAWHHLCGLN